MSGDAVHTERDVLRAEDAQSRILAQTCFERPVVLEAGAGTGKTTSLVARTVVWALGEGWERAVRRLAAGAPTPPGDDERIAAQVLQRIVAITFTEAAAAEMARRVGETLARIAAGGDDEVLREKDGLHLAALPAEAGTRSARAKALVGALDRLGVRTLHAFARRLLAAHPVEAGIHPAFEVDGDGSAAAELVAELLEVRLREAYGEPGDPLLLGLAACGVQAAELEENLLALLLSATPPELLEEDPFDAARVDGLRVALAGELERLCALAGASVSGNRMTKSAAELVALAGEACNRLRAPAGDGVAGIEALQARACDPLAPRLERLGEWAKAKFTPSEAKALGAAAVAEIQPLAASLHRRLGHLGALDAKRLDLGRRALALLLAEAAELLRSRGVLSYDGLLRRAATLLEENAGVAAHERAQIDQLLVDEFQDTDGLQCAMVAALALGGAAEERPGLFLVGDPKQSIYGWRGADLGAYDAFVERVVAAGGLLRRLSVNYRSVQSILDEVECVIRPAMHEARGVQPAFQPLLAHRAGKGFEREGRGAVEYWVSRVPREDASGAATKKLEATALEARALARDVAHLVRACGVPAGEIGVLLRSFTDVEEVLAALREAGVPYAVARDRGYYRRREIIDATCLVRCVVDPGDALAFVALLRSSAVGVPDAALLPLWRQKLHGLVARLPEGGERTLAEIRQAVFAAGCAIPAGVPGIEAVRGWEHGLVFALEALCALRESFARDPSDVFIERLRSLLLFEAGEAARPLGAFRLANLERFFRELGEALAEGADPAQVLRQLRRSARERRDAEEARPVEAAEQAVQVMSIHKAKGLGFAHTYVVQLHREPRGRSRSDEPARALRLGDGVELRLLGQRTPGFLAVEATDEQTAAAEHVRLLYVAMTRAKERLVLAGLWPEAGSAAKIAASHVALLGGREAGVPPLDECLEQLREQRGADRLETHGAVWVFPALREAAVPDGADEIDTESEEPGAAARAELAAADAERIAAARAGARARMQRRFGGPVTQDSHEWHGELLEARRDEQQTGPARETLPGGGSIDPVASAVGSALHRALELLDPSQGPERARAALQGTADRVLASAGLDAGSLAQARERIRRLVEGFVAGELFRRLERIAPHILARELPVLLAPSGGESGPAAYVAGRIDLVYRDPETGEPVVADYKTGRTEGEAGIREAAARYGPQGAAYVRALRDALGLARDPRFELWFLHAGRIETAV